MQFAKDKKLNDNHFCCLPTLLTFCTFNCADFHNTDSICISISGRTVRVAANIFFSGVVALRALPVTSTHKDIPPDPQVRFLDLADLEGINDRVDS